jgi:hypothetical protein
MKQWFAHKIGCTTCVAKWRCGNGFCRCRDEKECVLRYEGDFGEQELKKEAKRDNYLQIHRCCQISIPLLLFSFVVIGICCEPSGTENGLR